MQLKFPFLIFIFSLSASAQAPLSQLPDTLKPALKDTSWKLPGLFSISASQTSLSNWQGGGQDNFNVLSVFNFNPVYKKNDRVWISKIDLQFGLIKPGEAKLYRKSMDQIFLLTKITAPAFRNKFSYSLQTDFRTQFAPGFNYNGDSIVGRATSDFLAPGYVQLALGLDFKPASYFTITFAPVAGKITIVNRQHLADAGAFGVEKALFDTAGNVIAHGKKIRYELGSRLIMKFKKEIMKNINLDSYLDLFSNYQNNPQNIDVVFNNSLTMKINKFFTASVISQMIYDDDIITKRDWDRDGAFDKPQDINGPRLQILSTIAVGFGINF
jgi:hypothetical protein